VVGIGGIGRAQLQLSRTSVETHCKVAGRAKARRQAPALATLAEAGALLLQMFEHRPEHLLGQARRAALVGIGKIIAARRRGSTHRGKWTRMQPQTVADIVEPQRARQLREEQRSHMAPRAEGATKPLHPGLARQLRRQVIRYQIANLPKNAELMTDWRGARSFFHTRPRGRYSRPRQSFSFILWDACVLISGIYPATGEGAPRYPARPRPFALS